MYYSKIKFLKSLYLLTKSLSEHFNMANSKSAEKRIRINERNRKENRFYKNSAKTKIKTFFATLETYKLSKTVENKEKLQNLLSSVNSLLDKATKKNIFHTNLVARKKSKLAAYLKSI